MLYKFSFTEDGPVVEIEDCPGALLKMGPRGNPVLRSPSGAETIIPFDPTSIVHRLLRQTAEATQNPVSKG